MLHCATLLRHRATLFEALCTAAIFCLRSLRISHFPPLRPLRPLLDITMAGLFNEVMMGSDVSNERVVMGQVQLEQAETTVGDAMSCDGGDVMAEEKAEGSGAGLTNLEKGEGDGAG